MISFITFILGIILGVYGYKTLFSKKKIELNTDECMEFLKEKGYYVNLNVVQDKEKKK